MKGNKWQKYEWYKKEILKLKLTPKQYREAIKKFCKKYGL